MMTLYQWKPAFQSVLRPAVARLAAAGVSANQLTIAAAAGSLLLGVALATWPGTSSLFLLLPVWLLARMALNAMDGMLAREYGQQSRLGAYLNELGDVIADAALYLPFALVAPFDPTLVVIVVLLSVVSEVAGIVGEAVGVGRRYEGPLGKSDRALIFGALGAWIGLGAPLPEWSAALMPLLAILLVITIIRRVRAGLAERDD